MRESPRSRPKMTSENSIISVNAIAQVLLAFPLLTYIQGFIKDIIVSILKTGPIPKHVGLIMDGNRTYAKRRNLPLKEGHVAGSNSLVHVLDTCYRVGVECVTIYAFSIENFNRSKEEVSTLFGLLRERLRDLSDHKDSYARYNKVQIKIIGNRSMIPSDILDDLEEVENKTKHASSNRVLNVCFPYTSRDDIVHCIKANAEERLNGKITKDDIDFDKLNADMYYGNSSPPLDVLIRTSGQRRLSDFLLWQCNYNCTIEFVDTLWPDFKFFQITKLLLKWSFYKTIEAERQLRVSKHPSSEKVGNIFEELPAHPPQKSVTQR